VRNIAVLIVAMLAFAAANRAEAQEYRCNKDVEIPMQLDLPEHTIRAMRATRRYLVLIFVETQCFGVYKDGALVPIGGGQYLYGYASTGGRGHETPLSEPSIGPDRVWAANKYHKSTLYGGVPMDNAMFFMRERDRDIAMHSGRVLRGNASHGCVRLPEVAAEMLFPVRDRLDIVVTYSRESFRLLWETGYFVDNVPAAERSPAKRLNADTADFGIDSGFWTEQ
jgi:hypothetical protein